MYEFVSHRFRVIVQVEGLCASWDDNADNDMTLRGTDEIVYSYAEFGNSYMVPGDDEDGEWVHFIIQF